MGASPSMGTSTTTERIMSRKYNTPMLNLGFEPGWLSSTIRNLANWARLSVHYRKLWKIHQFKLTNLSCIRRLIDKPTDKYMADESKAIYCSVPTIIRYVCWWCGTDEYKRLHLSIQRHRRTYPQVDVAARPWPHGPYVRQLTDEPMGTGGRQRRPHGP
jgi:hypothetical protein